MNVFTIGFTKTSAESFFTRLQRAAVKKVVDVRLNNISQLSGFAKKNDLKYFLKSICGIEYIHEPALAPTQELLDAYKKAGGVWIDYERSFLQLMASRRIEHKLSPLLLDGACLLCSEDSPQNCHRRLVAEYLQSKWGDLAIRHL